MYSVTKRVKNDVGRPWSKADKVGNTYRSAILCVGVGVAMETMSLENK